MGSSDMPEKRKTPAARAGEKRIAKPPAAASPALDARQQLSAFEAAMKRFHEGRLAEAGGLFSIAAAGPESDVANGARLRMAICDHRLRQETVEPASADEYYNYGVALINTRKLAAARENLERALALTPQADHVHYALALAQALGGDIDSARNHLARAIELEPRNRLIARQDADFAPLARHPMFSALLYPERRGW
jgi:tetratricopeptide (TPR) repeat protein